VKPGNPLRAGANAGPDESGSDKTAFSGLFPTTGRGFLFYGMMNTSITSLRSRAGLMAMARASAPI
jgi:hypothetical protein